MTKSLALSLAVVTCAAMIPHSPSTVKGAPHRARVLPLLTTLTALGLPAQAGRLAPPTDAQCLEFTKAAIGIAVHCYSPEQVRRAYNVTPLLNAGLTGRGQTIVIVNSFGSPTIEHDLKAFDAAFNLPDPPSFRIVAPLGTVPFDPTQPHRIDWALETTLDVQWAHAIAPEANIVLLTSPVDETEGVPGMPEFLFVENYALDHHLGEIISQSWGTTENDLFDQAGQQVFGDFERLYRRAKDAHVTVLAATGDSGATNPDIDFQLFPFRSVIYPSSSPFVTAVGGTSLNADADGNYLSESVWNGFGATGGGISQQFAEPSYQKKLPPDIQALLGRRRGLPDVSWNADPVTGIILFESFAGPAQFVIGIGGTSASTPQWAGIAAIANQHAGRPLGFLNAKLYRLAAQGRLAAALHDITIGNNSFAGVVGFGAQQGWDAVSGWGTPDATELVLTLSDDPDEDDDYTPK
jgi:subtilase family serine protease